MYMKPEETILSDARELCASLESRGALPTVVDACREGQAVAGVLECWGADELLQSAALLHKAVCLGAVTSVQIAEVCHPQVAQLCRDFVCLAAPVSEYNLSGARLASIPAQPQTTDFPADPAELLAMPAHWQGSRLTYQRIRAYCAAYRDTDLALLQAAVLWRRFERARDG